MSENNGTPFRPFAKQQEAKKSTAQWIALVLIAIAIIAISYAVTVATTYVALVWLGDFDLSFANVTGIAAVWYIADVSIINRIRSAT
jgi:hypothetical protein